MCVSAICFPLTKMKYKSSIFLRPKAATLTFEDSSAVAASEFFTAFAKTRSMELSTTRPLRSLNARRTGIIICTFGRSVWRDDEVAVR